jgi:DUF971 family protein
MTDMPRDLQASRAEGVLRITWADDRISRLPFLFLRGECGCAGCVDEGTGVRTLDLTKIPRDIAIQTMELVGNYAIRIGWSDGHNTGLYTWQRLDELSRQQT